jgi:hypothetical protein
MGMPMSDARAQGRPVSWSHKSLEFYLDGLPDEKLIARVKQTCAGDDYYTAMLGQDVQWAFPYGLSGGEGFTAELSGSDDEEVLQLIIGGLDPEHVGHSDLTSAVADFGRRAAQFLVTCGPLVYEVGFLMLDDETPSRPIAFDLQLVLPGTIGGRGRRPIQYVPRAADSKLHRGMAFRRLDPATLVTFDLGEHQTAITRAVRFLREASSQQRAEYELVTKSMESPLPYEPMSHVRQTGDLIAAATVRIGWASRGLYKDNRLDPYVAWRNLQFLKFKTELRTAIMRGLNEAFRIAGDRLGFEVQLEIRGLPNVQDVDSEIRSLQEGNRSLSELILMV